MSFINRRGFLKGSASVLSMAALGFLKPQLLFSQGQNPGNGRNLIQIFFTGGYDGLALFPYYDGPVYDYLANVRQNILIDPAQIIPVGNQDGMPNKIGLHPHWDELATAADGNIKVIQMTGTRSYRGGSHALLQQIHSRGVDDPKNPEQRGWFGRISETQKFDLFQAWGVGVGNRVDFRTNSSAYKPLVVSSNLSHFQYRTRNSSLTNLPGAPSGYHQSRERDFFSEMRDELFEMSVPDHALTELITDGIQVTNSAIDTVQLINDTYDSSEDYESNSFASSCRALSKVLRYQADNPAWQQRSIIAFMEIGGWDTHGGQIDALDILIPRVAKNLALLVDELKGHDGGSPWNNTTISMNTDFGRTTKSNATGSDHGHSYSNMILGGRIAGGILGSPPSMGDLQNYNKQPVTDYEYRDALAEIIYDMGIDPYSVFTESGYLRKPIPLYA